MEKKTSRFSFIVILAFFLSAIFLFIWQYHWPQATILLDGKSLDVLVAKTPKHWYKGVGGRESLDPYDGMLFVFGEDGRHGIVMRDTLFPLDIIWLYNGVVVDIAANIPTEIGKSENQLYPYRPRTTTDMVLELPAGWVDQHGLKIGDKLTVVEE